MHNYNFVDIQINEDKDMEQVYFYTIENNNICSENLKEIKQYEDFLKNKENIIAIENNKYVNIGYINKEKNVEKQIVTYVKNILTNKNKTKIQLNIKELDINVKLLVSKLLFETKNDWSLKSKGKELKNKTINLNINKTKENEVVLGIALGKSQTLVQELVNMPSNVLTPLKLAQKAKDYVLENELFGVKVNILEENELKEQKMGSFLGVAKGSKEKPALLVMEYNNGPKDQKPIVLVGKGLTFDSGGISIKPSNGMDAMKTDMAGAATVIGALTYAAQRGLKINMVGIAACCENMPSSKALKPGDVIYAMDGTSIEVIDTDAEGRLVLADALLYSQKYDGKYTIDMATLTGACVVALGNVHTGLFTNDDMLAKKLVEAGKVMNDLAWQLPLTEEYEDMLESKVADISNLCLGRGAGAQNGAVFLQRFAPKTGWCHLDIAGTSNIKSTGATSRPLALISEFLDQQENEV